MHVRLARLRESGWKILAILAVVFIVLYVVLRSPSEVHVLRDLNNPDKTLGVLFLSDPPGADVTMAGRPAPLGITPLVITPAAAAQLCPETRDDTPVEFHLKLGEDEQTLKKAIKSLATNAWKGNADNDFRVKMHPGLAWRFGPGLHWTLLQLLPWASALAALAAFGMWWVQISRASEVEAAESKESESQPQSDLPSQGANPPAEEA